MLEAVVFDFDGVIYNSPHYIYLARKNFFKKYDIDFLKKDFKKYLAMVTSDFVRQINEENKANITLKELNFFTRKEVTKLMVNNHILKPGIKKLLDTLKKNKIKVAIASSNEKETIKEDLKKLGLLEYFKIIVSKEDVTKRKPDPESFRLACKKLNVNPLFCVGIEDSPLGVVSINKAGLKSIALISEFTNKTDFKKVDANLIINSVEELSLSKLKKLIN
ncbi:MAG: HAD family phosphatase [Candidatus ainarchaeum sp.]|nr:HAD family phosphatase [Candidatus ainarchaeum sp.]MDD4220999.1 HAD family phosphatase [Candidatus ainarchaeum sp.]